jgi:predicted TPR repeat methyltransferase
MNPLQIKDRCRRGLLKYTRKAFLSIPPVDNAEILDIGCGTGVPTLEITSLDKALQGF